MAYELVINIIIIIIIIILIIIIIDWEISVRADFL